MKFKTAADAANKWSEKYNKNFFEKHFFHDKDGRQRLLSVVTTQV